MQPKKTHREVKNPKISARYLADYMAASEKAKRSIIRGCKYQPIARVVQHNEAKAEVSKFIREGGGDVVTLLEKAQEIRERLSDSDFEQAVLDHNADYIERFAGVANQVALPKVDILKPGPVTPIKLNGVAVTTEIHFRLRRLTKTNKVRVGAAALRYAKGKPLPSACADWHAAFLFGYLNAIGGQDGEQAEHKLCLILDAYTGICHSAPTNATSRYQNMEAACATIAEWWPKIEPPAKAVL